jgi:hypothetical protein
MHEDEADSSSLLPLYLVSSCSNRLTVCSYADLGLAKFYSEPFEVLLDMLTDNEIIFVMAGGQAKRRQNLGRAVSEFMPQCYGGLDSDKTPAIIVGGFYNAPDDATKIGTIPPETYRDPQGKFIAVYGPYNQQCKNSYRVPMKPLGTSGATAMTSGVIAEWLSIPDVVRAIESRGESNFPAKVRGLLRDTSLLTNYPQAASNPVPNVVYNGMRDNACSYQSHLKARRDDGDGVDDSEEAIIQSGTIVGTEYASMVSRPFRLPPEKAYVHIL